MDNRNAWQVSTEETTYTKSRKHHHGHSFKKNCVRNKCW